MKFLFEYKGITNYVEISPKGDSGFITQMNGTPCPFNEQDIQDWRFNSRGYYEAFCLACAEC